MNQNGNRVPAEHRLRLLVVLAAAVLASGCVYALGPHSHIEGAELPFVLPEFPAGAPVDQLVSTLGPPSSRKPIQNGEQFAWHQVVRPRGCRVYLFGFIPLSREPRARRDLIITASEGLIQTAIERYTDRSSRVTSKDLLSASPATGSLP
jgi:hypothetical protein